MYFFLVSILLLRFLLLCLLCFSCFPAIPDTFCHRLPPIGFVLLLQMVVRRCALPLTPSRTRLFLQLLLWLRMRRVFFFFFFLLFFLLLVSFLPFFFLFSSLMSLLIHRQLWRMLSFMLPRNVRLQLSPSAPTPSSSHHER